MRFEPVIALPSAWTSVCEQFVLHLFEGHLSLADMEHMRDLAARWLLKNPGRRVEMVIILPSSARMSFEERQRMARLIKQGERERAASATVILAEGLLASVQRGILTGLMMLAPAPHPVKVFASVPDAVRWLHPYAAELMTSLALPSILSAVEQHVATFRTRTRDDAASLPA